MMKTIEKKRSKSEDRHVNADPKIEVKLLRSQSGQVIFLETGRDFVELLFAIMNAPLSSLISNFSQGVNDLHPFLKHPYTLHVHFHMFLGQSPMFVTCVSIFVYALVCLAYKSFLKWG